MKRYTGVLSIVFTLLTFSASYGAETIAFTIPASQLEARGELRQLKYFPDSSVINLNDRYLLEDDAPGNGPPEGFDPEERAWAEKLTPGVRIRKEFILDDPRSFAGYLVFNGYEAENNEHPLHISINGTHFTRPATKYASPHSEHYYLMGKHNYFTDNWFVVPIPGGALTQGINTLDMWTETPEPAWEMVIATDQEYARGSETRTHHPNRSMKSSDGGATWNDEQLGWKDAVDGEYAVRLSLDRWAPTGTYVSPVIDIAEQWGTTAVKKALHPEKCNLDWDIDMPEGTNAVISIRLGYTPVPTSPGWTNYQVIYGTAATITKPEGRYLQFMVELSTDNPLLTPSLKNFSVYTDYTPVVRQTNVMYRLVEMHNGEVTRPSVTFEHEDFAKMSAYREKYRLDEVVAGAATEFERQVRLLRWAYKVPIDPVLSWEWDFYSLPIPSRDADGNTILAREYTGRRRDHHCLMSNFTLLGACLAMGYPARYVNLQTEGRLHAHEVMEVWSNDFNKWVFMDATRDYYCYDPDTGIPLSLTEINERLGEIIPMPATWRHPIWWQIPDEAEGLRVRIAYREGNNPFSIRDITQGPHLLFLTGQLHMVTRNDFASRPHLVPWRVKSGHWAGNQFYGFYTDTFPRKREYKLNTNRVQDFNFPLNQSELTLSETPESAVLRVEVDTVTPCFETFLISFDDGRWNEETSPAFLWPLHEGMNTLRVRTRNAAGACGPVSLVNLIMNN